MSFGKKGQTIQRAGRKMTSVIAAFEDEAREFIPRILAGRSAKVMAREAGCTPRHLENIKQGQCLPGLGVAIAIARQEPMLKAFLRRWLDDPCTENEIEFMTAWQLFQQLKAQQRGSERLEREYARLAATNDRTTAVPADPVAPGTKPRPSAAGGEDDAGG